MSLRYKLALVSLCLLVLPWSGWQLLRQMEGLLRQGQEQVLLASAEAVARSLQATRAALPPPAPRWFVQRQLRMPRLDGDFGDWASLESTAFAAADGSERLRLALSRLDDNLYLRVEAVDDTSQRADAHWPRAAQADHLQLSLEGSNGLIQLRLANAASGALIATALDGAPAPLRISGEWRERVGGYAVELLLPPGWPLRNLGVQMIDAADGREPLRIGIGVDPPQLTWPVWERSERGEARLRGLLPEGLRARLVDSEGWIFAEAGELPPAEVSAPLPWWKQQLWYGLVFADEPYSVDEPTQARSAADEIWQALSGVPATAWRRDRDAPRLLLSVALPLREAGDVRGVLLLQREQQTLLLADQALSGLLLTSLLAMLGAGGVLLLFASRLSQRIRRLRDAAEGAFGSDGQVTQFEPSGDRDEVGDLSRSFARLLREVGASQSYLRGLAGKLSHELNTPLAVVRGALDNIDPDALDGATRNCVERAQGGSERLSAIVRAMSEASRVEQAVSAAEGEDVDLVAMLRQCADSYRSLLAPRELQLQLPAREVNLHCAPELLVQALDKLIDNARSFCPEDGWVRLALEQGAEGPQIVVANRGPRLPEAVRHRLFESLVSVRPGGRSAGVHLGFGLFIVRLVAERHGGSAEAHDLADGSGVEFVLRLRGLPRAPR